MNYLWHFSGSMLGGLCLINGYDHGGIVGVIAMSLGFFLIHQVGRSMERNK